MIKKLGHILTYHDSEPTEVLQGLIWFMFAPLVLEAEFFPDLWYVSAISSIIGFGTLYSVVYSSLKRRRIFGYLYGSMAIVFITIHFLSGDFSTNPMNWGWVVIAISGLSNIRRITRKIQAKQKTIVEQDISKMYREDLEQRIETQEKEIFDLRLENIKLKE